MSCMIKVLWRETYFGWKISFLLWKLNTHAKLMRLLFCNRGLHRLITGATTITNSKKQTLSTHFLRCIYCESHFFTNKRNKSHYRRIMSRERADFSKAINVLSMARLKNMTDKEKGKLRSGNLKTAEFKPYPHKIKKKKKRR